MTISLIHLRKLAKGAVPGPWHGIKRTGAVFAGNARVAECPPCEGHKGERNLKFIAAANPQYVIGMIDKIEQQEEAISLTITCLSELYQALGVSGFNEARQHGLALKTIEDLHKKGKECELISAHVERLKSTGTDYINIEETDEEEHAATIAANFNNALIATPATSAKDRDTLQRTKALTNAADWFRALYKPDEPLTAETVQDILNDLASQHVSEFFKAPAQERTQ